MRVLIPQPLQSYTGRLDRVEASGDTLDELLWDLDRQYPGIRFRLIDEQDRVRPHMLLFVRGVRTRELGEALTGSAEVVILHALSGG